MRRFWGLLLLGFSLAGCGSSSSDAESGSVGPYGGQTGSLRPVRPSCGTPPSFEAGPSLPGGDAVLVYYDETCAAAADDFALTDAEGNPIDLVVEELADGGLLIKADQALEPGDYQLEGPGGSQTIAVTEPAPVPSELGTLTAREGCPSSLVLQFSEETIPYLPLLSLSYRIDGGEAETWYDYGLIGPNQREVELGLAWCPGPCLRDGTFDVQIEASIAGETARPDPVSQSVSQGCPVSSDDGEAGCSVARSRSFSSVSGGCLLLGLLLVGRRGRRRAMRGDRQ